MEPLEASKVFEAMPTIDELFRIFPISFHALGIFLIGYFLGRKSLDRLIDHLEKRKD